MKRIRWWVLIPLIIAVFLGLMVVLAMLGYNPRGFVFSIFKSEEIQAQIDEREQLALSLEARVNDLNKEKEILDKKVEKEDSLDSIIVNTRSFVEKLELLHNDFAELLEKDSELEEIANLPNQDELEDIIKIDQLIVESQQVVIDIYSRKLGFYEVQKQRIKAGECFNNISFTELSSAESSQRIDNCLPEIRNMQTQLTSLFDKYSVTDKYLHDFAASWLQETEALRNSYRSLADGHSAKASQYLQSYEELHDSRSTFPEDEEWLKLHDFLVSDLEQQLVEYNAQIGKLAEKVK